MTFVAIGALRVSDLKISPKIMNMYLPDLCSLNVHAQQSYAAFVILTLNAWITTKEV